MPAVLVTRGVPEQVRAHLSGRCRVEVWEGEGVMPRAELLDRVAGKAGLMAPSVSTSGCGFGCFGQPVALPWRSGS